MALSQGIITEGSTHSLCTFPKLITLIDDPAARAARCSYGSETFRRSEPQASEPVSMMPAVKIKRSEGETAPAASRAAMRDKSYEHHSCLPHSNVSKQARSVS